MTLARYLRSPDPFTCYTILDKIRTATIDVGQAYVLDYKLGGIGGTVQRELDYIELLMTLDNLFWIEWRGYQLSIHPSRIDDNIIV